MVSKVEKYGKSTCFIDFFTCHIDFQRAWHYFKKYIFSVFMYFCQVTSILKGLGSYRKTGIFSFCGFLPSRIDSQRAELRLLEVRPEPLSQINETVSCMCARGVQAGSMPN